MSKKNVLIIGLLIYLIPLILWGTEDWEYRGHYGIKIPISSASSFKVKSFFWFNDNFENHYLNFLDVGIDHRFAPWFTGGIYYRNVNGQSDDWWRVEYRYHVNAALKYELSSL